MSAPTLDEAIKLAELYEASAVNDERILREGHDAQRGAAFRLLADCARAWRDSVLYIREHGQLTIEPRGFVAFAALDHHGYDKGIGPTPLAAVLAALDAQTPNRADAAQETDHE